jgi:hypothetical protein
MFTLQEPEANLWLIPESNCENTTQEKLFSNRHLLRDNAVLFLFWFCLSKRLLFKVTLSGLMHHKFGNICLIKENRNFQRVDPLLSLKIKSFMRKKAITHTELTIYTWHYLKVWLHIKNMIMCQFVNMI